MSIFSMRKASLTHSWALLAATLPVLTVVAMVLVFAPAASASFGIEEFKNSFLNQDGSPVTQAGSHPYEMSLEIFANHHFDEEFQKKNGGSGQIPDGSPKDVEVNLPAGLILNIKTVGVQCREAELENGDDCPAASAVGVVTLTTELFTAARTPIYNMQPPSGVPGELGFNFAGLGVVVHIIGKVRTGGDNGLSGLSANITQDTAFYGFKLALWGDPSATSHDPERGFCAPRDKEEKEKEEIEYEKELKEKGKSTRIYQFSCPVERSNRPFLTMPESCTGEPLMTTLTADSWQEPGALVSAAAGAPAVTGCEKLDFSPSIEAQPSEHDVSSPTGLSVNLRVPQEESLAGLAESKLKDAVVTLPVGVTVSPSAAGGLEACSPQEIGLHNAIPPSCPEASKVGSVEIITPLLERPLKGALYLAQQETFESSLIALYLVAEGSGALVKVPGRVSLDPVTGQITGTFDNNPQLPFNELRLEFFGGPRAALVTPSECGTYTTTTQLTPWSAPQSGPPATPSSTFTIDRGCHGPEFAPSFTAGTVSNQAGTFSPFTLTISRNDPEQDVGRIQVQTPPGLLGVLTGVPLCGEPQAAQGACPAASQIGSTTAAAGPGADPFWVPEPGQPPNPVYLTGPYDGAPFGLSIVVNAIAGPFDLGRVVVRSAITVDPRTAQLTVTSDTLPQMIDNSEGLDSGIPTDLRMIYVTIDRPRFIFNPTSCDPLSLTGTLASVQGTLAGESSRFQATGCSTLAFKPKFTASTNGRTSKTNGASLSATLSYPASAPGSSQATSEANIARVKVELPKQLPSRLTTLQKACTGAQFDTNPAGCPPASIVGAALVHTPVLPVPLTGPVFFVSHGGEAFPSLVVVLQGYGVRIDVEATTFINKKGITSLTFKTAPDAPFASFQLASPQGPHSALAANGNLCKQKLTMPTELTAQNGATIHQSTPVAVTNCPKTAKRKHAKKKKAKTATHRHQRKTTPSGSSRS
jgi:hypothetical protein